MRPFVAVLLFAVSAPACTARQEPEQIRAPISDPDGEVGLRCGSESLRARIREDGLEVQQGDRASRVLAPRAVPGANGESAAAYADGEITLYRLRDGNDWTIAEKDGSRTRCTHETVGAG